MTTHSPPLIDIKDVHLNYDLFQYRSNNLKEAVINLFRKAPQQNLTPSTIAALKGVNLTLSTGDRLGIIGLNGSGKSTLLKVIAGILKPSMGSVLVNGRVQPLIEIGAGFNPEFTGRENIYFNGYMLGFNKKQIHNKEAEIIAFSELGHFIDTPVKYYSSGMSVRLAFTIATMIEPEILAVDEMLAAGDAAFIEKAKRRVERLLTSAKGLICVSHDLDFLRHISNRILVMNQGQVAYIGDVASGMEYYKSIVNDRLDQSTHL